MSQASRGRGVAAWLGGRLAVTTLLLSGVLVAGTRGGGVPESALTLLLAGTYVLSLASALLLFRAVPGSLRERAGVLSLPAVDLATVTGLVALTGGASSGFAFLYGLSTLAAAIVASGTTSRNVAIWSVLLYVTTSIVESNGWLGMPPGADVATISLRNPDVGLALLRNVLGLAIVGALAGVLAERLRRTGGALAEATRSAEEASARADAAERLAALGRVAAGLAHELRNPLSSISGSVQLVREAKGLDDEDRKLLGIVVGEVDRLEELVGTMLELGRPKPLEKRDTDLCALVRDVGKMMEAGPARAADVHVELHTGDGCTVHVDADQIRQVVWNLVKNAVQASPPGASVQVRVVRAEGGAVSLEVRDEGDGIPAERLERIFDVFVTGRKQGTGLGLALVRQIVDAHGATIEVESAEGRGATFRVRFGVTPPAA